jgi:hypothetical protein
MAAVINGRKPTMAMGNSAILPTLHPSAKAQVDAIERLKTANAAAMERGGIGEDAFEAVSIFLASGH